MLVSLDVMLLDRWDAVTNEFVHFTGYAEVDDKGLNPLYANEGTKEYEAFQKRLKAETIVTEDEYYAHL